MEKSDETSVSCDKKSTNKQRIKRASGTCDPKKRQSRNGDRDADRWTIPLNNLSAAGFCEATDLYNTDRERYKGRITAILNRPNSGGKLGKAAPNKHSSGSFTHKALRELERAHRYFQLRYPHCYGCSNGKEKAESGERDGGTVRSKNPRNSSHREPSTTWNDLLLFTACYLPSEIRILEHIDCHRFMRIANSKLQRLKPTSECSENTSCKP